MVTGISMDMPANTASGKWRCERAGCGKEYASAVGLIRHTGRSHGTGPGSKRKDETTAGTNGDPFELVGRATEVLFPDGIPASRIIEIAGLQREMLKVVTRK